MEQIGPGTWLALALAAAGVAAAAYYIARWMKGSIAIDMWQTSFGYGDVVRGSFGLVTRKRIVGNALTASLVATETREERGSDGKTHHHSHEIHRSSRRLEGAKVYPPGLNARYEFELPIPPQDPRSLGLGEGSTLGKVLGAGLDILDGRRVSWKVEVRLDAEGVDLADDLHISVDGSGRY